MRQNTKKKKNVQQHLCLNFTRKKNGSYKDEYWWKVDELRKIKQRMYEGVVLKLRKQSTDLKSHRSDQEVLKVCEWVMGRLKLVVTLIIEDSSTVVERKSSEGDWFTAHNGWRIWSNDSYVRQSPNRPVTSFVSVNIIDKYRTCVLWSAEGSGILSKVRPALGQSKAFPLWPHFF